MAWRCKMGSTNQMKTIAWFYTTATHVVEECVVHLSSITLRNTSIVPPAMPWRSKSYWSRWLHTSLLRCCLAESRCGTTFDIYFAFETRLLRSVMGEAGTAMMGIGRGSGKNRAKESAEGAIMSALLDVPITGAQGIVFNVLGGNDMSLQEVGQSRVVSWK